MQKGFAGMFTRSKIWAIALLLAVFIAGGAAGWAAPAWLRRGGPRMGRSPTAMAQFLARRLDLSPAQQDSVRAILVRSNAQQQAIWGEVRPRFDSLRSAVRAEINALLTPEQRERHKRLLDELEHRHDRRDTITNNQRRH
jgi:Spy/CpxP family protein refolding chaperone